MNAYPIDYRQIDGVLFPDREEANSFSYSDGEEFERRIASIIGLAKDRSLFSAEIRNKIWDWRSSCHLSPVRANILRPIERVCTGRVLELGSGCGIITRYLGELGGDITALEGAAFRAGVTRARTADLANVKVVCDRIEDFDASEKFDLVTMIGVLQYARLFSNAGDHAEVALIESAARQLNDDGVLVIAIQNKLGLKYLAGYPEANAGVPYFGVEGRYGPGTVVRFGIEELKELLEAAGLKHHAVMLPLPDYHLPTTILSDKSLKRGERFSVSALLTASVGSDRARSDWTRPAFSLEKAWESVDRAGLTLGLANAFLVIAGKSESSIAFHHTTKELAWHYSAARHPPFTVGKRFLVSGDDVSVERFRLSPSSETNSLLSQNLSPEYYARGRLWWSELVDIVNRDEWSAVEIGEWLRQWIVELCAAGGLAKSAGLPDLETPLPGFLFDLTPMNCIHGADNVFTFIDNEWQLHSPLQLSYLIIRGIFGSLIGISSCAKPGIGTPLNVVSLIKLATSSIDLIITEEMIDKFIAQEGRIQSFISKGVEIEADDTWAAYVRAVSLECRVPELEVERLKLELDDTLVSLEREAKKLDDVREELRAAMTIVESQSNSLSWRVTAPLRAIGRLLRKV